MKYLLISITIWLSLPSLSQPNKVFSPDELREDFKIMIGSLRDFHPGLYWYRPKREIDNAFETAYAKLNHSMDEHEYLRILGSVISKIGCSHTQLRLSDSTYQTYKEENNYFPLSVIALDNKLYATQSVENSIDAGNEILSINDLSTDSLIQIFEESHWTEGLHPVMFNEISRYFKHYSYPIFIGNAELYIIEYIDSEGNRRKSGLEKDLKKFSSPIVDYTFSDNLTLSFHSANEVSAAILDVNVFFDWKKDGKKYKFSKKLRSAFKQIDSSGVNNLIIDLRDNGGGRAPYELFSYLYDSNFTFFNRMEFILDTESVYAKYCDPKLSKLWISGQAKKSNQINDSTYQLQNEPMLKEQKPSKPQFLGNVYVLINGGCFSATSDLAALIKSHKLATFFGTETGGSYYGNTSMEDAWVTLPNSKVRVKIPLVRHFLSVEPMIPLGRGVIPDYKVEQSITDLKNGVDTQMEFVFTLLKEKSP
ncbi:S41 family peptidase [Tunicatimonas pelagia]|uniref:S41 family peptidase n=1 Tax=Tunicatimonas pelagia TaxID=931531 RepID=UPI0026654A20|nr:S41 family peptidase [Tunicatimonas pelagia]WKN42669.1 S41 family peptidase [Tunicatimonas pelagia]